MFIGKCEWAFISWKSWACWSRWASAGPQCLTWARERHSHREGSLKYNIFVANICKGSLDPYGNLSSCFSRWYISSKQQPPWSPLIRKLRWGRGHICLGSHLFCECSGRCLPWIVSELAELRSLSWPGKTRTYGLARSCSAWWWKFAYFDVRSYHYQNNCEGADQCCYLHSHP